MNIPTDRLYTASHEWVQSTGDGLLVGLTDFAQDHLGEIVYLELPSVGDEFEEGESFAEAESVKAVSEIYAPLAGSILEVNEELADNPAALNAAPYDSWLVKLDACLEGAELMDAQAYQEHCETEA